MEQNHIIHKVIVEVSVNNEGKAYEIKDNISSFLTITILPKLEKHFNTLQAVMPVHTIQISSLAISTESQSCLNSALEDDLIDSFKKALIEITAPVAGQESYSEKALTEITAPVAGQESHSETDAEISLLTEEEKLVSLFFYFLENGSMPWWNSAEKPVHILESATFKKIVSAQAFTDKIIYFITNPKVRDRIINQLTDIQIKQVCLKIIQAKGLKIELNDPSISELIRQSFTNRKVIWSLILDVLTASVTKPDDTLHDYITQQIVETVSLIKSVKDKNAEKQTLKKLSAIFPSIKQNKTVKADTGNDTGIHNNVFENKLLRGRNKHKKDSKTADKTVNKTAPVKAEVAIHNNKSIEDVSGYYVQNAGLVLIHPFLSNLFRHCGLVDSKTMKLIDPETCIHLLHYMATGKTKQPESSMLFEKFLCGFPLHESINRHSKLSRKHKSEAAKVIKAVQENWGAMKTASIELLRNEFFQRSGKLVLDENQTLTIEHKTQDILLDKLSWGIGLIKLPWQNQFIYVNW